MYIARFSLLPSLYDSGFALLRKLLRPDAGFPQLPVPVVERLVLQAAAEFFDNAQELHSSNQGIQHALSW
jgi:hypothetical protein